MGEPAVASLKEVAMCSMCSRRHLVGENSNTVINKVLRVHPFRSSAPLYKVLPLVISSSDEFSHLRAFASSFFPVYNLSPLSSFDLAGFSSWKLPQGSL
jgi:hypothetical protein